MKSPDGYNYHVNEHSDRLLELRALNDALRLERKGGYWRATSGIADLGYEAFAVIRVQIAAFDDFTFNNDPFGEHDFGKLKVGGRDIYWKIDYYDKTETYHSPDPADPAVTSRYLTVMLAEEY